MYLTFIYVTIEKVFGQFWSKNIRFKSTSGFFTVPTITKSLGTNLSALVSFFPSPYSVHYLRYIFIFNGLPVIGHKLILTSFFLWKIIRAITHEKEHVEKIFQAVA